ncbi:MAG: hypothetical protein ACAF41_25040 [Leptolyngbya sp. BL-A-14]
MHRSPLHPDTLPISPHLLRSDRFTVALQSDRLQPQPSSELILECEYRK